MPSAAPTPPAPPPPFPTGFVPPPPRPTEVFKTRPNCKRSVSFTTFDVDGNGNIEREEVQERWSYECKFSTYVEVDVSTTGAQQPCACGIAYSRNVVQGGMFADSYETEIEEFRLVSFDWVRNAIVEPFPPNPNGLGFESMSQSANVTADLLGGLNNNNNFTTAVQGFFGYVDPINMDSFPKSMRPGLAEYSPVNVAALCFNVREKFISLYKWPNPPMPVLFSFPNTWKTQCYPYYDPEETGLPAGTFKRNDDFPAQKYWFMDFLTFPIGMNNAAVGGANPAPRYLTSFYRNSNCQLEVGVVTFDREFKSELTREENFNIYGAFAWKRTFISLYVAGGVPKSFSNSQEFWNQGFTEITWFSPISRVNGNSDTFRPGVLFNALTGVPEADPNDPYLPYGGDSADLKLCKALPDAWRTCSDTTNFQTGCLKQHETYKETAFLFKVSLDDFNDPDSPNYFDCTPAFEFCTGPHTTFLSFQNHGSLERDFGKKKDSWLLTGPRRQFCQTYPSDPVFDTLIFEAYKAGTQLRKRGEPVKQRVLPLRTIAEMPLSVNENFVAAKRKRSGEIDPDMVGDTTPRDLNPTAPPIREPERDDVFLQPGAGSANSDGHAGGDHPIALFPETYTVPVTLNPSDDSLDTAVGAIFDGVAAPCLDGALGCTCRTQANRPKCDTPYVCNDESAAPGFCEVQKCPPGQPGCLCGENDSCESDNNSCVDGFCVFEEICDKDTYGCFCSANDGDPCNGNLGKCGDGYCYQALTTACTRGSSGCACTEASACLTAGDECDEVLGVCVAPSCERGAGGCKCDLARCAAGFECDQATDRCKERRCVPGENGCPCDNETCKTDRFQCKALKADGTDRRCVATGKDCSDQTQRCIKFCGAGRVVKCPPCSDTVPICFGDLESSASISSVSLLGLALLALVAALL